MAACLGRVGHQQFRQTFFASGSAQDIHPPKKFKLQHVHPHLRNKPWGSKDHEKIMGFHERPLF